MKYEVVSFLLFPSLLLIAIYYYYGTSLIFGQENQDKGLVRCSAGNLVKSSTECPSTYICPPSERLGTVVQCSPGQVTKPLQTKNNQPTGAINISTSKPTYKFGEIVNITIIMIKML
ncbi:MAG: hypothetical protein ACM3JQ_01825 [Candidatus Eiseniibacteriota bacterium]